mmetsp:Transcript_3574/g.10767  ORF Transcript_3574/g.10767 Transcript_3574/m.10767 type:complete len:540 (+) Transcript_3574:215-1834(+)
MARAWRTSALYVICTVMLSLTTGDAEFVRVQMEMGKSPSPLARYPHPQELVLHEEDGNHVVTPLYGGITSVGEYYAIIKIGGQDVRVQIDTGSATLAVPMDQCKTCRSTDKRYIMSRSTSPIKTRVSCDDESCAPNRCSQGRCLCGSNNQCCSAQDRNSCGFFLAYGDGSGAEGALARDYLEWGGVKVPVTFGGILSDSSDFERPSVDGILGMAYPRLACNPSCIKPVFDTMVEKGIVKKNIFTVCMGPTGGALALGGFDTSMAAGEPFYEPLTDVDERIRKFYSIKMTQKMLIGERTLELEALTDAIVDSGTTLIVVSKQMFAQIQAHFLKYHCDVSDLCAKNTWFRQANCVHSNLEGLSNMPTIRFPLKSGNVIELKPEHYLVPYTKSGKEYKCVGFLAMDSGNVIFGNTVNMRYVTIYDREKHRVGFAERSSTCGDVSECARIDSCSICAGTSHCAYDYQHGTCVERSEHSSVLPYPYCHGRACFCRLGRFMNRLVPLVAGLVGGIMFATLILAVVRWRRRRQASYETVDNADYEW